MSLRLCGDLAQIGWSTPRPGDLTAGLALAWAVSLSRCLEKLHAVCRLREKKYRSGHQQIFISHLPCTCNIQTHRLVEN